MPSPTFVSDAFGFILVLAIPIVAALWKVFSALTEMRLQLERRIESLADRIVDLQHSFDLRSQQIENLSDRYELTTNGLKERVEHVATRTRNDCEKIHSIATDVERYITKTTNYEPRSRG